MATGNTGSNPFSRWQLALALGATGVLGLGYYWYYKSNAHVKRAALAAGGINSVSIEDVKEASEKPESPLQLAIRYKTEGNQYFKKGQFEEAIAKYVLAIEICPPEKKSDLSTFYQNRAAAYEQQKKWPQVIEDCTKALELQQKYEKALLRRAKAYEITKDWENCLDDITSLCLLQGFQNQSTLMMADRVLKELGRMHAAEAMAKRTPQLTSKHFIKTYFSSFSEDPVYNMLMSTAQPIGEGELKGFLKAKLAFATDKFDDIIGACTEEINSSESESSYFYEALSLRATFHLLSGNHKAAYQDLDTIIGSENCNVKIRVNSLIKRASMNMQLGDLERTLQDFEKAAELGPEISDVYHHRGQINLLTEKMEDARRDFDKAVELNPEFAIAVVQKCYANYRYAVMAQDTDLLMKSMEEFRTTIDKFSTCCEAYVLYAQVLAERQEYDKAEKLYLKALEVEPKNSTIYVHRGLLHVQWKGDIDQAVNLMRQAIQIDSKSEFAYETLGTVEVQRGNVLLAIDLFDKAIALARTELEMSHLFSLRDAARSQLKVSERLGVFPAMIPK